MNFDEAIGAHSAWKQKLSLYLRKPDGSLNATEISKDNKCALGQWVYGEGSKFSKLPEYATLKNEHAAFHRAAAEIVKKADSGESVSEEIALGSKSAFSASSSAVVSAIMHMKMHATK